MKSRIFPSLAFAAASALVLSGCIDEVKPEGSTIVESQLQSSVLAAQAAAAAMPAMVIYTNSDNTGVHSDFGYPSMMVIRDRMTGDMTVNANGTSYDHFSGYSRGIVDENYQNTQLVLNYYGLFVSSINKACAAYPADSETDTGKGGRAVALAMRAFAYLDMARWYEYLPCEGTSPDVNGTSVLNLTVPIVTENTTDAEAQNNPRATRQQMFEFIKNDLEYAEENIHLAPSALTGPTFPDLAVIYGLYARLYMWVEDYANAQKYADLAISTSKKTPLTQEQWTNPINGFNTPTANNSWMLCGQLAKENRAVTTGIVNFTSWMSPEYSAGYSNAGATMDIDYSMYNRIKNSDFRKLSWVPNTLVLLNKITLINNTAANKSAFRANFKYGVIKFRPGEGNTSDNTVACAVGIPLMRVEEMHFISIEAKAHQDPAVGKQALIDFMKKYRDASYSTSVSDKDEIVEEIVFQKRVELWGEGQTFWDIKRLNYSVTRGYKGTNWVLAYRFNTNGRPAWMNLPFVQTEGNANRALVNNPNVSFLYGETNAIPDEDVDWNIKNW